MDYGERYTLKTQAKLERRMRQIYRQAQEELVAKLNEHNTKMNERAKMWQAQLESGKITPAKFNRLMNEKIFTSKQWKAKIQSVTSTLLDANRQANAIVEDKKRAVYGENALYQAYRFEKDYAGFSFDIYDSATITRMIREEPELLPRKVVNGRKDEAWNRHNVADAITQGIIQGESIRQIANRIAKQTASTNEKAMVRYARTAMTAAQNAGRIEAMHEAQEMGIKVQKLWQATLDNRTRDSHAHLDGEIVDVDDVFSNGLEFPGDPKGAPGEVYNCRCALKYVYPEFADLKENAQRRDNESGEVIEDMTYSEWRKKHPLPEKQSRKKQEEKPVVQGNDISKTWERRPDKFKFEIQDIVNAQGFDGLPRVVSKDEFDKAVAQSKFIAQRTYSAPDQQTLDAYRNMLYNGEWYIDCSNGGAALGRGMYAVYANGTEITEYMRTEMEGYKARRGVDYNYIETFTLTPDAKTITPKGIQDLREKEQADLIDEFNRRGGWANPDALKWASKHDLSKLDDGAFAAAYGYDAILTSGLDDYAVILNRTKCIFLRGG